MSRAIGSVIVAAVTLALGACVSVDYMGKSYAPTERVDVYFAMDEVKRPYEIMGRAEAKAGDDVRLQKFQDELVKEAQKRGADAIVIQDSAVVTTGTTTSSDATVTRTGVRRRFRQTDVNSHSTTTALNERIITTEFLKYTDR